RRWWGPRPGTGMPVPGPGTLQTAVSPIPLSSTACVVDPVCRRPRMSSTRPSPCAAATTRPGRSAASPRQPVLRPHVLDRARHARLVRAPARPHAERRAMEDGFDPADLPVLDLEQLGELPCPVDPVVIEERDREHDPLLAIDRDESPVADPRHDASDARLELLLARDPGAGPGKDVDTILESHAVVSE